MNVSFRLLVISENQADIKPDERIGETRLIEKWRNDIFVSESNNKDLILCFRSFDNKLLNEN